MRGTTGLFPSPGSSAGRWNRAIRQFKGIRAFRNRVRPPRRGGDEHLRNILPRPRWKEHMISNSTSPGANARHQSSRSRCSRKNYQRRPAIASRSISCAIGAIGGGARTRRAARLARKGCERRPAAIRSVAPVTIINPWRAPRTPRSAGEEPADEAITFVPVFFRIPFELCSHRSVRAMVERGFRIAHSRSSVSEVDIAA
jgi:hypothetical protein